MTASSLENRRYQALIAKGCALRTIIKTMGLCNAQEQPGTDLIFA